MSAERARQFVAEHAFEGDAGYNLISEVNAMRAVEIAAQEAVEKVEANAVDAFCFYGCHCEGLCHDKTECPTRRGFINDLNR